MIALVPGAIGAAPTAAVDNTSNTSTTDAIDGTNLMVDPILSVPATPLAQISESSGKLKVMCLHGWRTSAEIMRIQLRHFPKDMLDLHYIDGTHLATGFANV